MYVIKIGNCYEKYTSSARFMAGIFYLTDNIKEAKMISKKTTAQIRKDTIERTFGFIDMMSRAYPQTVVIEVKKNLGYAGITDEDAKNIKIEEIT